LFNARVYNYSNEIKRFLLLGRKAMTNLEGIDWLNGYKNKTHIYAVYKKPTSDRPQDTYRLKVRGWKNIFHTNGKKRKLE